MVSTTGAGASDTASGAEGSELAVIPRHDARTELEDMTGPVSNDNDTLLPSPVARAISFATRSTGLAIRMGSAIGCYGLDAAKFTTLSSFELGRTVLEGILSRAGRDAVSRADSNIARQDAETILETAVSTLHHAMGHIVFWTATGFNLTSTTLSVFSDMSQVVLSMLDQFFGSTDSSRAMASIVAMIRREFENPATGVQGETVGVVDLVIGLCSMAYLQRSCHSLLEDDIRALRVEETVWDVVVLSDGVRVDIHNDGYNATRHPERTQALQYRSAEAIAPAIPSVEVQNDSQDGVDAPTLQLQREIMRSLPDNAQVSITREVSTSEIITVEITGDAPHVKVEPPPGLELIEESWVDRQPGRQVQARPEDNHSSTAPRSRLVFRRNRRQETKASFQRVDGDVSPIKAETEFLESPGTGSGSEREDLIANSPRHSMDHEELHPFQPSRSAMEASVPMMPLTPASDGPVAHQPACNNLANQKRPRSVLANSSTAPRIRSIPSPDTQLGSNSLPSRSKNETDAGYKLSEKKSGFRGVLKKPMSIFHKDDSILDMTISKKGIKRSAASPPTGRASTATQNGLHSPFVSIQQPSLIAKSGPPSPVQGTSDVVRRPLRRTPSTASFFSVHESRRESTVSLTETYSLTSSGEHRHVSVFGEAAMSGPVMKKVTSETHLPIQHYAPERTHRRLNSKGYTPSIYTLKANASETSLVPYHPGGGSAFSGGEALGTLRQAGVVDGMFPRYHLLRNITRYMRFASASYGSKFLKVLGIATEMPIPGLSDDTHHELRSFAHHTRSDPSSILLSSFIDPQGGSDGSGSTNTGVPLVHYVSLDHESKAVVLTCRGTLGFEDVLTDMTCEYDELVWRGRPYKVHKGVHASAKRLLYGGDGRVLYILKTALEEFPDYGLILTGHSLGGAVTSLLGVMLSEPAPLPGTPASFFVTSSSDPHARLLPATNSSTGPAPPPPHVCLPPGRPIHVYAYGPPSTMCPSLSASTRGLVTTVVYGNDLVPYLSLGVLHDFQAVALALKTDNSAAKTDLRQRVWGALRGGIEGAWRGTDAYPFAKPPPAARGEKGSESDYWAYAALKVLRSSMLNEKLVPPGEVFLVESQGVLRRDAFVSAAGGDHHFGRPATRIVLKYVRNVERRFAEVRFGVSMLTDHSPGKYEAALDRLMVGVMGGS
jgi:hypothetical protein